MPELKPRICVDESIDALVVYDITGAYDSVTNDGGFGVPNPEIEEISGAWADFWLPGQTENDTPITVDIWPELPDDTGAGREFPASVFGMDKIKSGKWGIRVRFQVGFGSSEMLIPQYASTIVWQIMTEETQCCVDGHLAKINHSNSLTDCAKNALHLSDMMDMVRWNAERCNFDNAVSILTYVTKQCKCCC